MGRKLYPPFDDGPGVPEDAWLALILRMPTVFEELWQLKQPYDRLLKKHMDTFSVYRSWLTAANKKWLRSKQAEALNAVIQLEFHYSDNTIKTGDALRRAMKYYKKYRDQLKDVKAKQTNKRS